jgi:hypothetical protein
MRTHSSFIARSIGFTAVFSLTATVVLARPAAAQTPGMTPAPQSAPPVAAAPPPSGYPGAPPVNQGWGAPPSAVGPNGEYVAPLSQTTQPYYVPQSVALSGPRFIKDWHDGDPMPWGYHREERARKGEIISGAILFGVPYIYSTFFAALGEDLSSSNGGSNPLGWLYLPVLGPFIEISKSDSAAANEALVLDGLAQGIGAALFFHGMLYPRPILVRNDLALLSVTPASVGKDGTGMMLMGTF